MSFLCVPLFQVAEPARPEKGGDKVFSGGISRFGAGIVISS